MVNEQKARRMSDFFAMGGYAVYVWSAYAIFVVVLVVDAALPQRQRRSTLRLLAARLKREAAKKSAAQTAAAGAP
jgi:heme exporter protein D